MTTTRRPRAGAPPAEDPAWWFAAIWLVFLVLPVGALVDSAAGPPQRTLAGAALLAFAAVYALAFRNPRLLPLRAEPANTLGWFCLLTVLVLLTVPALGVWAFAMTQYLSALCAFRLPLRQALTALVVLLAAVLGLVLGGLLPPGNEWVLVMYGTSTVIIGGMRLLVHRDEQHLALASELALAREARPVGVREQQVVEVVEEAHRGGGGRVRARGVRQVEQLGPPRVAEREQAGAQAVEHRAQAGQP